MSERPVHVVVVAYHAPDALAACLESLERRFEVTVVDNSSSLDVAAVTARHGADYVDCGRNVGFAAGVNMALARLAHLDADVLLLNPDAVIEPDAVRLMTRFMQVTSTRVAAVAPRLLGSEGADTRVAWPFPTPTRMWIEAAGFGRLPARRTFVVGSVLLLRREAIADVGGFDERFFLYGEETDWQRRAHARGWTSAVCSEAHAQHAGAGTSADPDRREVLFHAAQETYMRKWYGRTGWWAYRVAACAGAGARATVLTRDRRDDAARRMLLYLRGPRRCAGLDAD